MLLEKWTAGQKAVHCVFIDLEKAYDRVPREELWECLPFAETSECYVRIIKDMYDGATTTGRSAAGLAEEFKVGVGLHQGSALSPFLFAIIMDKLTEDIRKDAPWGKRAGCQTESKAFEKSIVERIVREPGLGLLNPSEMD